MCFSARLTDSTSSVIWTRRPFKLWNYDFSISTHCSTTTKAERVKAQLGVGQRFFGVRLKARHQRFVGAVGGVAEQVLGCVGCVDGMLIPLAFPPSHREDYLCQDGFHAFNTIVVSDDKRMIWCVFC